ncbi:hypothetical protein [Maricaulis salignorans]|uniref:Hemerythrin HHE cation binding domain-containing protein n=1 Tax=Maricaulis salignorans TaxID=144026 RepID=A0A1G9QJ70_9PROT|nr:hypothetical protein [Maricaulis salignorans]SDM11026.1 hypothetical protein SAMN04488568_10542 [Maricaulis salignorans]
MFDTRFDPMDQINLMQENVLDCLGSAVENTLSSVRGAAAFQRGIDQLDRLSAFKADHVYAPLSADPLAREYVAHLDEQLLDLMARIDVLRTHVELGLEVGSDNAEGMADSLLALVRQLRISFSREAALIPVYAAWQERAPLHTAPPRELQLAGAHL